MLFFSHAWLVFVFDLPYISFHERSHIMKVNGIVAEYNPFHNGHAYQMQHAKLYDRRYERQLHAARCPCPVR